MTTYSIIYRILAAAVLYYLCPLRLRWMILLLFSLAIYATGGGQAMCFILLTILSTYLSARMIDTMAARTKTTLAAQKTLSREEKKLLRTKSKNASASCSFSRSR